LNSNDSENFLIIGRQEADRDRKNMDSRSRNL